MKWLYGFFGHCQLLKYGDDGQCKETTLNWNTCSLSVFSRLVTDRNGEADIKALFCFPVSVITIAPVLISGMGKQLFAEPP